MNAVTNNLYKTFAAYHIGDDFVGCDCCVTPGDSAKIATRPIRDLAIGDLERYSRKAMSTWGTAQHFKHFLPRLLELTIEYHDYFLDLSVVFGKLKDAGFESWPPHEQDAVNRFFVEYWDYQLAVPITSVTDDTIDTVLCALSNGGGSVQPYLDRWLNTPTDNAKRHLASFILWNDDALLMHGRLFNPFWKDASEPTVRLWSGYSQRNC